MIKFITVKLSLAYGGRMLHALAPTASGQVPELVFPDELHAANLHFFDLVEQASLPAIPPKVGQTFLSATPEPSADKNVCATFLKTLRAKFEELADAAHPLCQALEKLATLETVRIIEGKA